MCNNLKEISAYKISKTVEQLCMDANYLISPDIKCAFNDALKIEDSELTKDILNILIDNSEIAERDSIPICQDTGMAVVFVEIGQDVHITGGLLEDAINEGVRSGYEKGYLRKSVVSDPINRVNTNDNTPAVIHYKVVEGENLKITVSPKGFGSENMSRLVMFKPSAGLSGVKNFILETVKLAGPNACPPMIIGVGIGGDFEKSAIMAKEALLREVGSKHPNEFYANLEEELLTAINKDGVGVAGLGGKTTALALHINSYATHIAGLPVAVNIGCHVTRHKEAVL